MSFYTLPKWDKNRPIFFQIGLISALALSNIVINYETAMPVFDKYVTEDLGTRDLFQQVTTHSDVKLPAKPLLRTPPDPQVAQIVTINEPIVGEEINESLVQPEMISEEPPVLIKEVKAIVEVPIKKKIFIVTENMPYLTSCDVHSSEEDRRVCTQSQLLNYINQNLNYPAIARALEIQGTVVLTFVIDDQGSLKDLQIARDIGGGCGQAELNTLKGLTSWKPGRQNNEAVNVKYSIPIKFKLH